MMFMYTKGKDWMLDAISFFISQIRFLKTDAMFINCLDIT